MKQVIEAKMLQNLYMNVYKLYKLQYKQLKAK